MKSLLNNLYIFIFLSAINSMASAYFRYEGKILRVEQGFVILKTESGEKKIALKNLNPEDTRLVKKETGSKKTVILNVNPDLLIKD